ncbi:MAG: sigma-70 family RNA polymerase sigma factor [Planctomycetota bacterium]|nr:sigma-70 family RNA polymerase sigma factor [Planctomycetota bacterium]
MKTDPELMREFRDGDETAFDKLVKRHQVGLLNFFYRLVWDHSLAEDLTQEVFMRLYTHKNEYEPQAKFTTYLYRIGRNCWIDYLRRTKSERKNVSLDAETPGGSALAETVPLRTEDPQETARKEELADTLVEAIDELPEDHKLVFILSEVQGMKYHEIGETLGIPVGTVKSRMFHAVKRLKDSLARSMKGATGPWKAEGETT